MQVLRPKNGSSAKEVCFLQFFVMFDERKSLEQIIEDKAEKPEILDAIHSNFEDFKALEAFLTDQRNLTFNNQYS